MGILEGPNLGDIAQYSRNFRLRRQQFQGAYGASRHKRCAGGSGGSNGSADEWRARRTLKPLPLFLAHVVSAACRGDWPQNPPALARLCGCPPGACPPSSGGCESERGGGGAIIARVIFDLRRCAHARGRTSVDKPVRNRTFIGPAARLCSRAAPSFEQRLRTATGVAKLACSHRDSSSCVPHLACRRHGCCWSAGGKPGLRASLRTLPVCAV